MGQSRLGRRGAERSNARFVGRGLRRDRDDWNSHDAEQRFYRAIAYRVV